MNISYHQWINCLTQAVKTREESAIELAYLEIQGSGGDIRIGHSIMQSAHVGVDQQLQKVPIEKVVEISIKCLEQLQQDLKQDKIALEAHAQYRQEIIESTNAFVEGWLARRNQPKHKVARVAARIFSVFTGPFFGYINEALDQMDKRDKELKAKVQEFGSSFY